MTATETAIRSLTSSRRNHHASAAALPATTATAASTTVPASDPKRCATTPGIEMKFAPFAEPLRSLKSIACRHHSPHPVGSKRGYAAGIHQQRSPGPAAEHAPATISNASGIPNWGL